MSDAKIIGYKQGRTGEVVDIEIPITAPGALHLAAAQDLVRGALLQIGQPSSITFGGARSSVTFAQEAGEGNKPEQRGFLHVRTREGRMEIGPVTLDASALAQLNVPVPLEEAAADGPAPLRKASSGAAAFCAVKMLAHLLGADAALRLEGFGVRVQVRTADGRTLTSELFEHSDPIGNLRIEE
jgi:hypothetical protein